ncbi:hypothetical protein [Arundinibacter roseus]|uniref:Uncharacterized protein n=1 Tax=Arundinibacter roseus TaxID=2070510 RepID=A0A4R4KJR6_9BACT|nr:hypothetical protein [Arundinibacter roseus]TDB66839.1 hypothetical protein EZE20_06855 [Arundinibacter roseus]
MEYRASEALCEILLKNGFVDTTHIPYPGYAKQMKDRGYDPGFMRRKLSFGGPRGRNHILFVEGSFLIYVMGNYIKPGLFFSLRPEELKSVIAFFKCDAFSRSKLFSDHNGKIYELYQVLREMQEEPNFYTQKRYELFREEFDKVKL